MKTNHISFLPVFLGLVLSAALPEKPRGFFDEFVHGVESVGDALEDAVNQFSDTVEDGIHIVKDAAGNVISEYEDIAGAEVYGCTVVPCLDVMGAAGVDCAIAVLKKVDLNADLICLKSIDKAIVEGPQVCANCSEAVVKIVSG